jgi:hypothetical protein
MLKMRNTTIQNFLIWHRFSEALFSKRNYVMGCSHICLQKANLPSHRRRRWGDSENSSRSREIYKVINISIFMKLPATYKN